MFNYSTSTLINTATDQNGKTIINADSSALNILRAGRYLKNNIKDNKIYKHSYTPASNFAITLDLGTAAVGHYRIALYIRLNLSNQSDYANDFVYKGRPFYFEFQGSTTESTIYTNIANSIKSQLKYGSTPYVTVANNTTNCVINGVNGYQWVYEFKVEKYTDSSTSNPGGYWSEDTALLTSTIVQGNPGFGTYDQVIKDLRLPTMENLRYMSVNSLEMPILSGRYTQYLFHYVVDRGQLGGGNAVGQQVVTETTHSFYVESSQVSAFEAALISLGLNIVYPVVSTASTTVTIGSTALDLSEIETTDYFATYTTANPTGLTGGVWSMNTAGNFDASGSDADFSKVTVASNGKITLATGHALAAGDKIGVQVIVAGITKTGQITIQA